MKCNYIDKLNVQSFIRNTVGNVTSKRTGSKNIIEREFIESI